MLLSQRKHCIKYCKWYSNFLENIKCNTNYIKYSIMKEELIKNAFMIAQGHEAGVHDT